MATKIENYSAEQTAALVAAYAAAPVKATVEAFAVKLGKTTRSIIAKLSKEGVYKKAEYVSKTGDAPVAKDVVADAIGKILRLSENDTSSLAKANKTALKAVFMALATSRPIDGNEDGNEDGTEDGTVTE